MFMFSSCFTHPIKDRAFTDPPENTKVSIILVSSPFNFVLVFIFLFLKLSILDFSLFLLYYRLFHDALFAGTRPPPHPSLSAKPTQGGKTDAERDTKVQLLRVFIARSLGGKNKNGKD
jgi:hypothetical protein